MSTPKDIAPKYIVGIDLGTTNSVVAYTEATTQKGKKNDIHIFNIPQLTAPGVIEEKDTLPSFVFIPSEHDNSKNVLELPWDENNALAVGEFAKNHGNELPDNMITSSKSWLCNTMVDRNKSILPWQSKTVENKLSPIEASSAILSHIRDAWNSKMASLDDDLKLENQDILLTVPASFDAVARELTVKAAEMTGLFNITLLEEPQAAFYSWIESSKEKWRDAVKKDDYVLVFDIGGGTTDFSLIKVSQENGDLALERVAVGNHLLVGGDNMDLTLAYMLKNQLAEKGTKLDAWQMKGLWNACRSAKENLLNSSDSDNGINEQDVTILGRGSSLIGGTIKTTLTKQQIDDVMLDGFFPHSNFNEMPAPKQKSGLAEFGLVYESDPAIIKHLAKFIASNKDDEGNIAMPTAVLFNGGVMKSKSVRTRVLDVINSWNTDNSNPIKHVNANDFDLAVARGAAYYGLARLNNGIRIRGGLSKSYYIGIAASLPAVPGMPAPLKAICVGAFGTEEGTSKILEDQEFVLAVGETVKFDFLGSNERFNDQIGTVIEDWESDIEKITTIEAALDGEHGALIPVSIQIKVTEIGTLELWCVSKTDDRKWKLEFNVRNEN